MRRTVTNFSTSKDVTIEMKSLRMNMVLQSTTDGHCAEKNVIKIQVACRLHGLATITNATFQHHAHPNISKKEETLLKML